MIEKKEKDLLLLEEKNEEKKAFQWILNWPYFCSHTRPPPPPTNTHTYTVPAI